MAHPPGPGEAPPLHQEDAVQLMLRFAERTGLTSDRPQQRYLWTDSFAVCNFLGMARLSGEERFLELALQLVDRVHRTLGRHRPDDARHGWISGLEEQEGADHPTRGGLRIGKPLPERRPGEPLDEQQEWDRDGQYFHYLTKWMHALDQVARATHQLRFNLWARELAQVAYRAFTSPGGDPRMVWKMSIDLTRPLVPSMGQHDPLDGAISCAQLQVTASSLPGGREDPDLDGAVRGFASMLPSGRWATADPLGLGGLLMDAGRVQQLLGRAPVLTPGLLHTLLTAALEGLPHYLAQRELRLPASRRLAFRELGLSLGLHAVEGMALALRAPGVPWADGETDALVRALLRFVPLGRGIESFWRLPEHRESPTWTAHRDINEVMLASSLVPEGCLVLAEA
jgi:hypothetical protein